MTETDAQLQFDVKQPSDLDWTGPDQTRLDWTGISVCLRNTDQTGLELELSTGSGSTSR